MKNLPINEYVVLWYRYQCMLCFTTVPERTANEYDGKKCPCCGRNMSLFPVYALIVEN